MSTATLRLRRHARRPQVSHIAIYAVLIAVAAAFLSPLVWMISTSLKEPGAIYQYPPVLWPAEPDWQNYIRAWAQRPVGLYLRNTMLIVVPCVTGGILVNSIVGYAFAVLDAPGKNVLFAITLAMLMIPATVTLIPTYLIFTQLGWLNTYWPFIVPAFLGSPFYIFLMRQFFLGIPAELRDAARLDGASEFRILAQIYLPLSMPAVATVGIFSFMFYWNDWFGPLIYLNDSSRFTLAVGLIRFVDIRDQTPWELLMSASVLMVLPILAVFMAGQRYFVTGITFSGRQG